MIPVRAIGAVALFVLSEPVSAQRVDTIRVRVHNHEVALFRSGDTGPVVVLEAGGGSSHRAWSAVVPGLARQARVVAYDRPGYGLSQPCDGPRTADRIARELHQALRAAGIEGPYILGGWSYGGAVIRVFAGNHSDLVSGLVLVDPAPEDFYARAAREFPDEWTQGEDEHLRTLYADSTRRTEQRETAGFAVSMEQARASDAKHSALTMLLIAGRDGQGAPEPPAILWIDELKRWAARRPNTRVVTVSGAGHHIARDKPEAVINAIRELLVRAR